MGSRNVFLFSSFICLCSFYLSFVTADTQSVQLVVNVSQAGTKMPETLFGVFIEEINHAVTGGLWAELVSNRG
ncbi:hypothetical protein MKW94_002011 [Papaver nudicaule]|uniref:Uncharacterized protein n=1 Tax=Papaver nudicaule TaxID=74823 RepID=A0AA41VS40_PAPNU|nr:hypothetical protein [Papaver nudicaule]